MEENDALLSACLAKDNDALRDAMAQSSKKESAALLAQLLLEDWHDSHEDIVFQLGLIGDPCAIAAIAKAIVIPFHHLVEWDNLHEFQRKCVYALARIGTAESLTTLEIIAQHPDPQLQTYGKEGLQKWPLKQKNKNT